jgi:hypothetical protein
LEVSADPLFLLSKEKDIQKSTLEVPAGSRLFRNIHKPILEAFVVLTIFVVKEEHLKT